MNTFKRKAIVVALLGGSVFVSGCGMFGDKKEAEAAPAQKIEVVQAIPACSFTAAPGQVLKIEGLSKLECYGNQPAPQIVQAPSAPVHPAWSILATALNVVGNVAGVKYAGDNTVNLVRAIGGITAGFSVQPNITVGTGATVSFGGPATGANSGSNSGNSGRIGNDDNSQHPTNTINCATGAGGAAAAGGNGAGTTTGGSGGAGGAGAPSGAVNCSAGK
jgi:hypothetical protein